MKKILVIEDDLDIRDNLTDLLTQESYQVEAAQNGKEGIESAVNDIPDLIISDIMMPEVNGFEVKKALNRNPVTETIPFVFLTAKNSKESRRYGLKLGADDYIIKPFTSKEILDIVKTRLARKELFDKKYKELRKSISLSLPHELLTPLTAVLGYASILKESIGELNNNEIEDYLNGIIDGGERLQSLITRFLLFAKLEMLLKNPNAVNSLSENLIQSTAQIIKSVAEKNAVKYERLDDLTLSLSDYPIHMEKSYFKTVVEEVVDNACKFSNSGDKIEIISRVSGNEFEIIFKNEGRGMTEEQIVKIGALMQLDRDKYEQQGGGLGLALTQQIINLHGGKLKIESNYGKDFSVVASIPIKNNSKKI